MSHRVVKMLFSISIPTILITRAFSQTAPGAKYDRKEMMIPMRDGVHLHTIVFTPKIQAGPALPFLLERTPYGIGDYPSPEKTPYIKDMADEGYIFVYQDIRGRYLSEGKYIMQRFPRDKKDPSAIDESTDTYDTFDWLLKKIPNNNGKGGMYGI